MATPADSSCAEVRAASRSGSEENKKQTSSPRLGLGDADTVTLSKQLSPSAALLLPCVGESALWKNREKKYREQLSDGS